MSLRRYDTQKRLSIGLKLLAKIFPSLFIMQDSIRDYQDHSLRSSIFLQKKKIEAEINSLNQELEVLDKIDPSKSLSYTQIDEQDRAKIKEFVSGMEEIADLSV
jgi:hypothetical protein